MSLAQSRPRLSVGPGDVLVGRYEVVREVGSGGFGTVFLARHVHTSREVALKLLHARYAVDDAVRERFRRETRAPAEIGHPGIVEVIDADVTEDGTPFIAMEWLAGKTLRDRYRKQMPQLGRILEIFEELLDALAAAHQRGYVHRDLKPDNTFVVPRPDGSEAVKLLDFGLARQEGSQSVTVTGTSLGTPRYMSPEQFMNSKVVGATTDVWAVGVMLYEMLAGAPPFRADGQHALMLQILTEPHRPLAGLAPDAPAPLVHLVERCLEKEPTKRIQHAGALLAELRVVRSVISPGDAATVIEMPAFDIAPEPALPSRSELHGPTAPMEMPSELSAAPLRRPDAHATKPSGPNALREHLAAAQSHDPAKHATVPARPLARSTPQPAPRASGPGPLPMALEAERASVAGPAQDQKRSLLFIGLGLGAAGLVFLVVAGVVALLLWPRGTQPVRVVEPNRTPAPSTAPRVAPMQPETATGPVVELPTPLEPEPEEPTTTAEPIAPTTRRGRRPSGASPAAPSSGGSTEAPSGTEGGSQGGSAPASAWPFDHLPW